jgi:hypothetical protein
VGGSGEKWSGGGNIFHRILPGQRHWWWLFDIVLTDGWLLIELHGSRFSTAEQERNDNSSDNRYPTNNTPRYRSGLNPREGRIKTKFLKQLEIFWFHLEARDVSVVVEDAEVFAEVDSWAGASGGEVEADGGGAEVGGVEVGGGGGGGGDVAGTDSLTNA